MSNCKESCRPGYTPGPPAPNYVSGCSLEQNPTFQTYVLPASTGTDEPGQPYQPRPGEWRNAIVIYEANNHIYLYDSLGTPTLIETPNGGGGGGSFVPDQTVQRSTGVSATAENVLLNITTGNLYSNTSNTGTVEFPHATPTSAGAMSAADYNNLLTATNTVKEIVESGVLNMGVVQGRGPSTTEVMSQNAVTTELDKIDNSISGLNDRVSALEAGGGGGSVVVVQELGESTTAVMSQKAVTDVVGDLDELLVRLDVGKGV